MNHKQGEKYYQDNIPSSELRVYTRRRVHLSVPGISVSQTGGEILQDNIPSSELRVYTRRRVHSNSKNHPVNPEQGQSSSPSPGTHPISPILFPDLDVPIANRKGVRTCTKHPIVKYLSYQKLSKNHKAFTSNISHLFVPRTIQEALDHSDWKLAVLDEMKALQKNGTWEIVDLPKEKKTVGCKWVFTIKSKADGSVERYKARLVAKRFTQTFGIDY